jgi:hypothetical protein
MDVLPMLRNQLYLSVLYGHKEEVEAFIVDKAGHRYKLEHAKPYRRFGYSYHCTYVKDGTRG